MGDRRQEDRRQGDRREEQKKGKAITISLETFIIAVIVAIFVLVAGVIGIVKYMKDKYEEELYYSEEENYDYSDEEEESLDTDLEEEVLPEADEEETTEDIVEENTVEEPTV